MTIKTTRAIRAPRADAARNRQRLLQVAVKAFAKSGGTASMDEIARTAAVGIGTLYRHYPTREALAQEVYRTQVEDLAGNASSLIDRYPAEEALRLWLHLFVDHLASKRLTSETIQVDSAAAKSIVQTSGVLMDEAVGMLVRQTVGTTKTPLLVNPSDLLRALVGVVTIYPGPEWVETAKQMADVIVAGVSKVHAKRHRTPADLRSVPSPKA